MKRYFIFGFLTILIITLNFAFIIVLVSENVRINYDVLFVMWVVVILAAAGLAYLEKTKHSKKPAAVKGRDPLDPETFFQDLETTASAPPVYGHKDIKKYKILLPSDMVPKVQPGFFSGTIVTEEYAQEKVQAIYTKDHQLLGYLNKKKKRLAHNIDKLYKEPILTWGEIKWDEQKKTYKVRGFVPILFDQREMNRFRKLVKLKTELLSYDNLPEPNNIFAYLEKAEKFQYLQQSAITVPSLDYEVEPEIIQVLCQKLLAEQRWEDILRFKDYPILVNRLEPTQKKEVLQGIRKAEKELVSS